MRLASQEDGQSVWKASGEARGAGMSRFMRRVSDEIRKQRRRSGCT